MPHIHQANNRPSPIRNEVLGSKPWKTAIAAARAIPPSTQTAWQTQGVVQGVSSLKFSILRPNRTHGQNSPVQPEKVKHNWMDYYILSTQQTMRNKFTHLLTTISIFSTAKDPSCPRFIGRWLEAFRKRLSTLIALANIQLSMSRRSVITFK